MTEPALQGVGVLVTRPAQQADALCRMLEDSGAFATRLPAIEIRPVVQRLDLLRRVETAKPFDFAVFTSANAVRFGTDVLKTVFEQPAATRLVAIGPATARALAETGLRNAITPGGGFDSESLLQHPDFAQIAGRRVLLVKGLGGRELLREQLQQRGACVTVAEVYERVRCHPSIEHLVALQAALEAGRIHVITATSAEIAASLIAMAPAALRRELDRVQWLVPGSRVAAAVRERGVTAPILQAATAEDQDLLAAIVRWRSSESGA